MAQVFVGYYLNSKCVPSSLPQLALILAWQELNKESNIVADDNVYQAILSFLKATKELDLNCWIEM